MAMQEWVKLPTAWIQDRGLRRLRWAKDQGSSNTAALMSLVVLAHHADQQTGEVQLTYDQLCTATGLSRPKIAVGLSVLESTTLVERRQAGRSSFKLVGFDPSRSWGKLPAKRLYAGECISFFSELHLRRRAELDALKLFLLIVARRNNESNLAMMSYETIEEYSGVDRNRIRTALTLLGANNIVYVDPVSSTINEFGISNGYRLVHIDTRRHAGTTGRRTDASAELSEVST